MNQQPFHIFTKAGDARAELESIVQELGPGPPHGKGLHKVLHVSRAAQTVVFVTGAATPLATALRSRAGWIEPDRRASDA
jgi:hypothetical protein